MCSYAHTHTNVYKYKCKRIENQFEPKRLFICNPLQWKVTKKQPVHFVFYDYDLLYVFLCSFWEREREGENIVQKREFFFFPLKFIAHTVYLTFISRKHVYDKVAVVLRGKGGSGSSPCEQVIVVPVPRLFSIKKYDIYQHRNTYTLLFFNIVLFNWLVFFLVSLRRVRKRPNVCGVWSIPQRKRKLISKRE